MRMSVNAKHFLVFAMMVMVFSWTAQAKSRPQKKRTGAPAVSTSAGDSADMVTEKRSDGTTVKYKKKTSYDFEGLGVEAMADKPTGAYISNIKDVKARSMIQIRKDFDAEVNESARQMP